MKQALGKALDPLRRPVPFVIGWRNTAVLALSLGATGVIVTLLLEPFNTAAYPAPIRTLRPSSHLAPSLRCFSACTRSTGWSTACRGGAGGSITS